jgi:hypothetical protein
MKKSKDDKPVDDARRCYVPYGALILTVLFTVYCIFLGDFVPYAPLSCNDSHTDVASANQTTCGRSGIGDLFHPNCTSMNDTTSPCNYSVRGIEWFTDYTLDFLIAGVTGALTLHLWWRTRNESVCLAFSSVGLGFLLKGFIDMFAADSGMEEPRQTKEFYVVSFVYYLIWTLASSIFLVLIQASSSRLMAHVPEKGGILESKVSFILILISTGILLAGCIQGVARLSNQNDEDPHSVRQKIFMIGRVAWHSSQILFSISAAIKWRTLATKQPVRVWGLSNSYAGSSMVMSLLLTTLSWVIEFSLNNSITGVVFGMIAYFGILMTTYFAHNLIFSLFSPQLNSQDGCCVHVVDDRTQILDGKASGVTVLVRALSANHGDAERLPGSSVDKDFLETVTSSSDSEKSTGGNAYIDASRNLDGTGPDQKAHPQQRDEAFDGPFQNAFLFFSMFATQHCSSNDPRLGIAPSLSMQQMSSSESNGKDNSAGSDNGSSDVESRPMSEEGDRSSLGRRGVSDHESCKSRPRTKSADRINSQTRVSQIASTGSLDTKILSDHRHHRSDQSVLQTSNVAALPQENASENNGEEVHGNKLAHHISTDSEKSQIRSPSTESQSVLQWVLTLYRAKSLPPFLIEEQTLKSDKIEIARGSSEQEPQIDVATRESHETESVESQTSNGRWKYLSNMLLQISNTERAHEHQDIQIMESQSDWSLAERSPTRASNIKSAVLDNVEIREFKQEDVPPSVLSNPTSHQDVLGVELVVPSRLGTNNGCHFVQDSAGDIEILHPTTWRTSHRFSIPSYHGEQRVNAATKLGSSKCWGVDHSESVCSALSCSTYQDPMEIVRNRVTKTTSTCHSHSDEQREYPYCARDENNDAQDTNNMSNSTEKNIVGIPTSPHIPRSRSLMKSIRSVTNSYKLPTANAPSGHNKSCRFKAIIKGTSEDPEVAFSTGRAIAPEDPPNCQVQSFDSLNTPSMSVVSQASRKSETRFASAKIVMDEYLSKSNLHDDDSSASSDSMYHSILIEGESDTVQLSEMKTRTTLKKHLRSAQDSNSGGLAQQKGSSTWSVPGVQSSGGSKSFNGAMSYESFTSRSATDGKNSVQSLDRSIAGGINMTLSSKASSSHTMSNSEDSDEILKHVLSSVLLSKRRDEEPRKTDRARTMASKKKEAKQMKIKEFNLDNQALMRKESTHGYLSPPDDKNDSAYSTTKRNAEQTAKNSLKLPIFVSARAASSSSGHPAGQRKRQIENVGTISSADLRQPQQLFFLHLPDDHCHAAISEGCVERGPSLAESSSCTGDLSMQSGEAASSRGTQVTSDSFVDHEFAEPVKNLGLFATHMTDREHGDYESRRLERSPSLHILGRKVASFGSASEADTKASQTASMKVRHPNPQVLEGGLSTSAAAQEKSLPYVLNSQEVQSSNTRLPAGQVEPGTQCDSGSEKDAMVALVEQTKLIEMRRRRQLTQTPSLDGKRRLWRSRSLQPRPSGDLDASSPENGRTQDFATAPGRTSSAFNTCQRCGNDHPEEQEHLKSFKSCQRSGHNTNKSTGTFGSAQGNKREHSVSPNLCKTSDLRQSRSCPDSFGATAQPFGPPSPSSLPKFQNPNTKVYPPRVSSRPSRPRMSRPSRLSRRSLETILESKEGFEGSTLPIEGPTEIESGVEQEI